MANDLQGYEVVLGVSGGIAAYKAPSIASALVQRGCGVTAVLTRAALEFITPLPFRAVTDRKVHTDMFDLPAGGTDPHIHLSQAADLLVIAPATADLIGQLAAGLAGKHGEGALVWTKARSIYRSEPKVHVQFEQTDLSRAIFSDEAASASPREVA